MNECVICSKRTKNLYVCDDCAYIWGDENKIIEKLKQKNYIEDE